MRNLGLLLISASLVLLQLFSHTSANAIEVDPTEAQRINLKCFAKIAEGENFKISKDDFVTTLNIYSNIDNNLKRSKTEKKYAFADQPVEDPEGDKYFVVHAKASFPKGTFKSLSPDHEMGFLEVYFVTEIDDRQMKIFRRRDNIQYSINATDFQEAFIWYSDLLDSGRAYIPMYGFLSIPSDTAEAPSFNDGWTNEKNLLFSTSEGQKHFEFYKVLDQQGDYFLLGESRDVFEYRTDFEIRDYGIVGWVHKKFVVLWRSRLYYHPMEKISFYDSPGVECQKSSLIDKYYREQKYPGRDFLIEIIGKKEIDTYDNFYSNFGFPQVYEPYKRKDDYGEVCILGILSSQIVKKSLISKIKSNINSFFLIDISKSMVPFKDFINLFSKNCTSSPGFGINETGIFRYLDSSTGNGCYFNDSFITTDRIEFGMESQDRDYKEPLMRALLQSLESIEKMLINGKINSRQYKFLFVLTDAGPNDDDPVLRKKIVDLANRNDLDVFIFFIYPDQSGGSPYANMVDTPHEAYMDLQKTVDQFKSELNRCYPYNFPLISLKSSEKRTQEFNTISLNILKMIEQTLDASLETNQDADVKGFLSFMLTSTLNDIKNWSDTNINIASHIIKLIKDTEDKRQWDQRIAIPAKIVEYYVNSDEDSMVTLLDLKKIFVVNSLLSVYDIEECRKIYKYIDDVLFQKRRVGLDHLFYEAVTGRKANPKSKWVESLSKDELKKYLKERKFYLNSVEQSTQQKYIYLQESEFFKGGDK